MLSGYPRTCTTQGMAIQGRVRPPLAWMAVTLAVALGAKQMLRAADVADLLWILAPLAKLTGFWMGIDFVYEPHTGYIHLARGLMIVPACAGVNFMIMAWCVLATAGVSNLAGIRPGLLWLAAMGPLAYGLALGVNSLRIVLSAYLYGLDIYTAWLTPDRLHRVVGILLYFSLLCALYGATLRILKGRLGAALRGGFCFAQPLFWYALLSLGIPLAKGSYRHQSHFWEHCLTVVGGCMVVLLTAFLLQRYQHTRSLPDETNHPDCGR